MLKSSSICVVLALGGCCLETSITTAGSTSPSGGTTGTTSGTTGGTSTGGAVDAGPYVTTLAGNGMSGYADGTGGLDGTAEFRALNGIAVDAASNAFVTDLARIRKIDPQGNLTTVAGNGGLGSVDGTGGPDGSAKFVDPYGIAVDSAGNLYVSDQTANRIRKIDPSGNVTTLAGNGREDPSGVGAGGFADGTGGPDGTAELNGPSGVALDGDRNLYVADLSNNRIRKVDPLGNVSTVAGNGQSGSVDGTGGPAGTAEFTSPRGVVVGSDGAIFVSEAYRIRKIDPLGNVTTLAGNGTAGWVDGTGGPDGTAEFGGASGLAVDRSGNVLVADGDRIRSIDPRGNVSTLAGDGKQPDADGTIDPDGTAQFNDANGLAVGPTGDVYVTDNGPNGRVRLISF